MNFSTDVNPRGTQSIVGDPSRPTQLPATEEGSEQGLMSLLKNPPELIATYPKVALAVALGIGVLLGCLIKRR